MGLLSLKVKGPGRDMETMEWAVRLKSCAAFSYKKFIKEEMNMERQMEGIINGVANEIMGRNTLGYLRTHSVLVTADMLDEAGIDPTDELEIFCAGGAVIIQQRSILERLTDELQEHFLATGLSEETLEAALRMEAENTGSVAELLEKLEKYPF